MGNLFLINESFETKNLSPERRDKLLINFCKALDAAMKDKDSIHGTIDIHTHTFSYGSLFYGFLLESITVVKNVETLKGISEVALGLYQALAFKVPGMIKINASKDAFIERFSQAHFGFSGFDFIDKPNPYVGCDICWWKWKIEWLAAHQNEVVWQQNIDLNRFLPNKLYSDGILLHEIIKFEKEESEKEKKEIIFDKSTPGLTFHDKVMRSKGNDIPAYTKHVGGMIATANYYIFDAELSTKESLASQRSLRAIYKIIGEDGLNRYISLDHKHGMFEFHNYKGEHLGEYKFDGSYNSGPEVSHNFKTLN